LHPTVAYVRCWARPPPLSTLFPYTPLFRSRATGQPQASCHPLPEEGSPLSSDAPTPGAAEMTPVPAPPERTGADTAAAGPVISADRKSTRLNSSHVSISYAVFCLKKKKHTQ